ncbi:MAG: MarR family transcriptional regulator [Pseudomonadota bacterium]
MSAKSVITDDVEIAHLVDRFMRYIHADIHRKAHIFDTEKVGPTGVIILMTLADLEPTPMHELVRHLARDKSQITRALQALDKTGMINRASSLEDGRVCVLSLSHKGRQVVDSLRRVMADTIGTLLAPLDPAERDTLKGLLRKSIG